MELRPIIRCFCHRRNNEGIEVCSSAQTFHLPTSLHIAKAKSKQQGRPLKYHDGQGKENRSRISGSFTPHLG
jgi:hypothetical protein